MAEWKKYSDTKEINDDIDGAEFGYKVFYSNMRESCWHDLKTKEMNMGSVTHYLICEPKPHAEMQAIWVKTGQPVEYFSCDNQWEITESPDWCFEVEYRFAQPKKEVIYYRDYLYRRSDGIPRKTSLHGDPANGPEIIETGSHFIKWLDDEWQELEV